MASSWPNVSDPPIQLPPDARTPCTLDCNRLAILRSLNADTFVTAGSLGTLKIATHYGHDVWILTDHARVVAEARRLDGLPLAGKKSLAIAGSRKNAPVGLLSSNPAFNRLKNLLLVEGMPDYFSALQLAIASSVNFRVASMLGAACRIDSDPGADFGEEGMGLDGSAVLIIPHNDPAGINAAGNWSSRLYSFGADKVRIQPLPGIYKDLNEFIVAEDAPERILQWFKA